MTKIEIPNIPVPTCRVVPSDGTTSVLLNEYEFNELRIRIKNAKEAGWTVYWSEGGYQHMEEIDTNGNVYGQPFPLMEAQLTTLAGWG